ncbi:hypothetical protein LLT3_12085 [Lactococcus cremoris subsp. cremoris TIFN3]|uniref:Uncharacterized protein n=1 Tax=Lactococcus cremoris subsp. cremoris TIFN3 TaxID=1234873 RepID=T0VFL4_LACLC|nr:hypothetical protein LLT3_12085 [Lactococcus cremoris subsp. cremoris TIFN3]
MSASTSFLKAILSGFEEERLKVRLGKIPTIKILKNSPKIIFYFYL